ncbi:hypothetical protein [Microbacterium binotii]|uniref:Uncharacterized protein n=1 Tax=Microbacterium binotii TaxID=462710 RepID=A0ABN3P6L5_9MICO
MTSHTYIHVSALVRGPIGPEGFTEPDWEPPAATAAERALVARFGGYRQHDYGGVTLGDALTREDLLLMTGVTLVATRDDLIRLDIAHELFAGNPATLVPREDERTGPAIIARLAAYDAEHRGLTDALLVHGGPPQWKGHLQRALAREGGETGFTVKTASPVTGFVNRDDVYEAFGEPRRTLIIDLGAVTDDDGVIRKSHIAAVHALAHEVDAYRTIIRVAEGWQVPDARLLAEILPRGQYADIAVIRDGHDFIDEVTRTSHYRRSETDTIVTLRGADDGFWTRFDERSWMLGTPTEVIGM